MGDISTAFLHALAASAGLVLRPPEEFYTNPNILWRLHKAMYGLRSSPKAWQEHLAKVLTDLGLKRLQSEPNVYTNGKVYIMVYVDDLLFIGEPEEVTRIYRPRCYCDTQALVQQARQSTSLVDESQTKETTLKFHSTTATPTTYYKKPTYSRRHQQLHQEQQLPRPHLNKRSYSTSRNMPNTDAWSESYNGFHTHDLT